MSEKRGNPSGLPFFPRARENGTSGNASWEGARRYVPKWIREEKARDILFLFFFLPSATEERLEKASWNRSRWRNVRTRAFVNRQMVNTWSPSPHTTPRFNGIEDYRGKRLLAIVASDVVSRFRRIYHLYEFFAHFISRYDRYPLRLVLILATVFKFPRAKYRRSLRI